MGFKMSEIAGSVLQRTILYSNKLYCAALYLKQWITIEDVSRVNPTPKPDYISLILYCKELYCTTINCTVLFCT